MATVLALLILVGVDICADFQEDIRVAQSEVEVMARIADSEISNRLQTVDILLQGIIRETLILGDRPSEELEATLRAHTAVLPEIVFSGFMDADGAVRASTLPADRGDVSLLRQHFSSVREQTDTSQIYIAAPAGDGGTDAAVMVARGVRDGRQRFRGVAFVAVAPRMFQDVLASVTPWTDGVAALFSVDPVLMARYPAGDFYAIRAFTGVDQVLRHVASGARVSAVGAGGDMILADRLGVLRSLDRGGLVIALSRARHAVLADWWLSTLGKFVAASLLSGAILVLAELVRRRAQQAVALNHKLTEIVDLNRKILSAANIGIAAYRADGACVFSNEAVARLTGGTPADVLQLNFRRLPAWDHSNLQPLVIRALETGDGGATQLHMRSYFGRPVWFTVHLTRFLSGGEAHLLLMLDDITERIEAETALREGKIRYRMLLDALPQHVFYKDNASIYKDVNAAFAKHHGVLADDCVGRNDLDFYPLEVARRSLADDQEVLGSGHPVEREETLRQGDRDITLAIIKVPVQDGSGAVTGLLGISWDITARKEAENALREATAAAEQANQAKSDFLANMSHEIRTPMNAILGMLYLLQKTPMDVRQRSFVDKSLGAANTLLAILNDILDFSKIEAGRMEIESTRFRLTEVISRITDVINGVALANNLDFNITVYRDVPDFLEGDPARLGQILINLANNAVKFTQSGLVHIAVETAEYGPDRVMLRFTVRDTGIGMPEDQMSRLFQAFSQGDTSTTRRYGGTGLGLAISRQLVELMGGDINVTSVLGAGSIFTFTARFGRWPGEELPPALARPLTRLRALVVDSLDESRQALLELLARFSVRSEAASSCSQALSLLGARSGAAAGEGDRPGDEQAGPGRFDVVFLDDNLGGPEAGVLCAALEQGPGRGIPVLLSQRVQGRSALYPRPRPGVPREVMVKPVLAPALLLALSRLVGLEVSVAPDGMAVNAPFDLVGLRLLLVEDNSINQEVARTILADLKAEVCVADNGAEALRQLETATAPFDAVLMDLHMPVMDGYATTRCIRSDPRWAALPVVAMTASAMAHERRRCLDAGMNEHIPKPIDVGTLVLCLRTLLAHRFAGGPGGAYLAPVLAPPPTPDGPASLVSGADGPQAGPAEEADTDDQAALSRLREEALVWRLRRDFFQLYRAVCAQMRSLVAAGNREGAKRLAHTVRGAAGSLGLLAVARAAEAVETYCAADLGAADISDVSGNDALEPLLGALDAALVRLEALILEAVPPAPEGADGLDPVPASPGDLAGEWVRLDAMIQAHDTEASTLAGVLARHFGPPMTRVTEALDRLDFAAAIRELATITPPSGPAA